MRPPSGLQAGSWSLAPEGGVVRRTAPSERVCRMPGERGEAAGTLPQGSPPPFWVILLCAGAMAAGTATGGWKVIRTLGMRLTDLKPVHGFAAETAAAMVLLTVSKLGIPVSTTHTITGSILGVGATRRLSAVRWGLTRKILFAWVFTLPGSALIAAGLYLGVRLLIP